MTLYDIIAAIVVDRKGEITRANALACELFGYPNLLGHHLNELIPPRSREAHDRERANYDRKARRMGPDREVFGLRADGTEISLWIGLSPLRRGRTLAGMIASPLHGAPDPLNPA